MFNVAHVDMIDVIDYPTFLDIDRLFQQPHTFSMYIVDCPRSVQQRLYNIHTFRGRTSYTGVLVPACTIGPSGR